VDEYSSMVWSYFLRRKAETTKKIVEFVEEMKTRDRNMVKFLRCNNSPENKNILQELKKKGINTVIEFTAQGTPEENGKVERMFATLWGQSRAMMNQEKMNEEFRLGLWTECANCATQLNNILIKENKHVTPFEEFFKRKAPYIKSLKTFGEVCIRTVRKGHQDKLNNQGDVCIFVDYLDKEWVGIKDYAQLSTHKSGQGNS
jgi:hypothetical protein